MAPIEPMIPVEMAPESSSMSRRSSAGSAHSLTDLSSSQTSQASSRSMGGLRAKLGLTGLARRTLGICLLMVTVLLWTLSNFLASYIFSDDTYSKPFFVVYINSSIFAFSLIPMVLRYVMKHGIERTKAAGWEIWRDFRHRSKLSRVRGSEEEAIAAERLLAEDDGTRQESEEPTKDKASEDKLTIGETAWLSLEFCMLWFAANYFASACLEYTTVASVTIFTSLSSMFTLIFCAFFKVEAFSARKFVGVMASLVGVALISTIDLSGQSDKDRGSFPHKSTSEMAIGDSMAFFSAVIYGIYVTVMKIRLGNEERVRMPVFFGLVGLFNLVLLWPVFIILHFVGLESFEMPPSGRVWGIILANSISSFVSDLSWAYAMLLTTPLVVTVGLSLTIPFSLVGEMIQYAQYSSWVYWVGACIVLLSFVFINHESHEEPAERPKAAHQNGDARPSTSSRHSER